MSERVNMVSLPIIAKLHDFCQRNHSQVKHKINRGFNVINFICELLRGQKKVSRQVCLPFEENAHSIGNVPKYCIIN